MFGCISRTLIRSKQLFDVWLKYIQSNSERHKPIDLIILLMMMTINDEKSVAIENIVSCFLLWFSFWMTPLKQNFVLQFRFVGSSRQTSSMLNCWKTQCEHYPLFCWTIHKCCLNCSILSFGIRIPWFQTLPTLDIAWSLALSRAIAKCCSLGWLDLYANEMHTHKFWPIRVSQQLKLDKMT